MFLQIFPLQPPAPICSLQGVLSDWSVSHASLEDVFLELARRDRERLEGTSPRPGAHRGGDPHLTPPPPGRLAPAAHVDAEGGSHKTSLQRRLGTGGLEIELGETGRVLSSAEPETPTHTTASGEDAAAGRSLGAGRAQRGEAAPVRSSRPVEALLRKSFTLQARDPRSLVPPS